MQTSRGWWGLGVEGAGMQAPNAAIALASKQVYLGVDVVHA